MDNEPGYHPCQNWLIFLSCLITFNDVNSIFTQGKRRAEASISAIRKLRDALYKRCQLPRTLKETGKVTEAQLDHIAEMALDDGSIMFNPKEVTLEDARSVLRRAWA